MAISRACSAKDLLYGSVCLCTRRATVVSLDLLERCRVPFQFQCDAMKSDRFPVIIIIVLC